MTKLMFLLALTVLFPLVAAAQTIPIKTVPVAEGGQFLLFPSQNLGMGGVALALDDPLLDPFVNPAKAVNTDGLRFASAPVYYGFTEGNGMPETGSGRTLPVGAVMRQGNVFGGAAIAWQELVVPQPQGGFARADFTTFADVTSDVIVEEGALSRDNVYLYGMTGLRIPGSNLSVGVSVFGASLNGMEGVRLLYQRGADVRQRGEMGLYRIGFYHTWAGGRAAELLVAHHRFSMTHTMPQWVGDRGGRFEERTEYDQTQGWAVQAGYKQPVGNGWTAGAQLTGDWKWHPKIPNYDLMQIPRDPGNSAAYNIGLGLARTSGPATVAADLIYEPIWSHTWADALDATPTPSGGTVAAGAMTVENFFRFHNARVRLGLQQLGERFDFRLGLDVHAIRYRLEQENFVQEFSRKQREHWSEWTASGGLGLRFPEFEIRYLGLVTVGTGQPGVVTQGGWAENAAAFDGLRSDVVLAPSGTLSLASTTVFTHQVSVILPLTN